MSEAAGLAIFLVVSMAIPVYLVLYIKWDSIKIKIEKKRNKKKVDNEFLENKDNFIKKIYKTYFTKQVIVDNNINLNNLDEKIDAEKHENLSSQELLNKQRKLEEAKKIKKTELDKKNQKNQKKLDEKRKLKEFKEKEKAQKLKQNKAKKIIVKIKKQIKITRKVKHERSKKY